MLSGQSQVGDLGMCCAENHACHKPGPHDMVTPFASAPCTSAAALIHFGVLKITRLDTCCILGPPVPGNPQVDTLKLRKAIPV